MRAVLFGFVLIVVSSLGNSGIAAEKALPDIPGLTAPDMFHGGCVDCHVNRPEANMDVRISTHLRAWTSRVDAKLLAKARSVSSKAVVLTGRHPKVGPNTFQNIPASCVQCHVNPSSKAPPFAALIHAIHLTGGRENHFLTLFNGQCTHCHKLDGASGTWAMPSGAEK